MKSITRNIVHDLSVSSACNVEKLVDVWADSVALLHAQVEAPFQVGGVIINHRLNLFQHHVKP